MKTVNIDSNDFGEIRQRGYVYVDKTAWLVKMATDVQSRMFFLARPRRFGKSLMISTLKAMFEGRKELFKGLDIMKRALTSVGVEYDSNLPPSTLSSHRHGVKSLTRRRVSPSRRLSAKRMP